jgi:glycosyltransferase involved in cell wall biosynthesis
MSAPLLSVIVCTHNPRPDLLARTLAALRGQTLAPALWELLVVDNASAPAIAASPLAAWHPAARVVSEPELGLTAARLRGIAEARSPLLVFVDDDNLLVQNYLADVARLFDEHPRLGAAGGPVAPEWEESPAHWALEFQGLLAVRDLGPERRICPGGPDARWPDFAPVGAGLAVRRAGALAYADALAVDPARRTFDRAGASLASGGDNDLVFTILHGGGDVGYFPELRLTHLIPRARLQPEYLARLNRGIMRTWVLVLAAHGQCPWPPVRAWTVPFRCARAWWRTRAWRSPARRVRWNGRCGQFQGQALLKHAVDLRR